MQELEKQQDQLASSDTIVRNYVMKDSICHSFRHPENIHFTENVGIFKNRQHCRQWKVWHPPLLAGSLGSMGEK